jgi:hypothetical protein
VLLRLQSSSNLGSLKETADHYSSEQSTSEPLFVLQNFQHGQVDKSRILVTLTSPIHIQNHKPKGLQ